MTEINFGLHSAGRGRLSCDTAVEHSWELRASRDDRNKCRSTLRWTRASRATRRLNPPGNCAPHAMTEINVGLHSAGRGRLVRHGGWTLLGIARL